MNMIKYTENRNVLLVTANLTGFMYNLICCITNKPLINKLTFISDVHTFNDL